MNIPSMKPSGTRVNDIINDIKIPIHHPQLRQAMNHVTPSASSPFSRGSS
jgi:hypothetical protein